LLTLYYAPGTCSLVSHIALEEAGAPHRGVLVDLMKGDQHRPDFLKVNPHARVPALVTEQGTITENLAILGFIADSFGAEGAIPRGDAFETARTMQFLSWLSGTVHSTGFAALFRPARFSPDDTIHPRLQEGARAALTSHFVELDDLCGEGWLAGGQFTAADSYAFVFYRWAKRAKFDLSLYPRWAGLTRRVLARPAVQRSLEQEGLAAEEWS
jgi:glutathione S-transferase